MASWQSGPASDAVIAVLTNPTLAMASMPPKSPADAPHAMTVAPNRLSRTPAIRPNAWKTPTSSSASRFIHRMPVTNVATCAVLVRRGFNPVGGHFLTTKRQTATVQHTKTNHQTPSPLPSRQIPATRDANTGESTQTVAK